MGDDIYKNASEINRNLDSYNESVKDTACVLASYKYANENYDGSLESWSSKQREGYSKARECFK